jgi:hypothetical protein
MLSAFCGRGEDRTQYLLACEFNPLPTKLSCPPIVLKKTTQQQTNNFLKCAGVTFHGWVISNIIISLLQIIILLYGFVTILYS